MRSTLEAMLAVAIGEQQAIDRTQQESAPRVRPRKRVSETRSLLCWV